MAPDLNSLPPSRPTSGQASPSQHRIPMPFDAPRSSAPHSPSMSHSPTHSLAAAATLNAGIQSEDSRRSPSTSMRREVDRARRRSSIRMNLNINDPAVPAPGELQISPSLRTRTQTYPSPRHERAPSLGELHQELENEQEAQVNRLLVMIRQQQEQIATLSTGQTTTTQGNSAVDDSTPTSERSMSLPQSATASQTTFPPPHGTRSPRIPPNDLSRQSSYRDISRGSSRSSSMRGAFRTAHHDSNDVGLAQAASRDESAYYQAETQTLTRENQMLKLRIRELERQIAEFSPISSVAHTPATASSLVTSPPLESPSEQAPALVPAAPSTAPP